MWHDQRRSTRSINRAETLEIMHSRPDHHSPSNQTGTSSVHHSSCSRTAITIIETNHPSKTTNQSPKNHGDLRRRSTRSQEVKGCDHKTIQKHCINKILLSRSWNKVYQVPGEDPVDPIHHSCMTQVMVWADAQGWSSLGDWPRITGRKREPLEPKPSRYYFCANKLEHMHICAHKQAHMHR